MLLVYTRDPGTGTLFRAGSLALPGGVDKIHRDDKGAFWLTVLPNAFATIGHMINPDKQAPSMALRINRSEEHTSELQSIMSTSSAVFCMKKKKMYTTNTKKTKKNKT